MRKLIKMFIVIWALVTVFIVNMCNVSAASSGDKNVTTDGDLSLSEEGEVYAPTTEDLALDAYKMMQAKKTRASSKFNKVLPVPVYKQLNDYYCGPATVKQVLSYVNGNSLSQEKYAIELGTKINEGTVMPEIKKVLNKYAPDKLYTYVQIDQNDYDNWEFRIHSATSWDRPVVINIRSNSTNWMYKTNGHYMCTAGLDNTGRITYVYVADPHPRYYGRHKIEAKKVNKVNMAHPRHAVIW